MLMFQKQQEDKEFHGPQTIIGGSASLSFRGISDLMEILACVSNYYTFVEQTASPVTLVGFHVRFDHIMGIFE